MDAATRRELDDLRRRAYGPGAGLDHDPVAQARLTELEDEVRRQHATGDQSELGGRPEVGRSRPTAPIAPGSPASIDASAIGAPPEGVGAAEPNPGGSPVLGGPTGPDRRPWRWAALAAAAAAVVAIAAGWPAADPPAGRVASGAVPAPNESLPRVDPETFAFVKDPGAAVLLRVPLDGSFGDYVDLPGDLASEVEGLADLGPLRWSKTLGEYYGWELWIARGDDDAGCVVVRRDAADRARCESADGFAAGRLLVTVPYAEIPDDERPEQMGAEQSVGFWWLPEQPFTIVLGRTDAT